MLRSIHTKRFDAQIKLCVKRGYDITSLKNVMKRLACELPLPERCRPHKLHGYRLDHWECHIKSDWLLVYRYDYELQQIIFESTGTHSDLF